MFVRVAISDPLPMFRRGMMATLSEAGVAVETPDDLVAWVCDEPPRVVMLTVASAEDWALLTQLRQTREDVLIVAVLADASMPNHVRALTSGAVGAVPRDASVADIRTAFEAAVQGRAVIHIDVLRALSAPRPQPAPVDDTPTAEQISWLRHLAEGRTIGQLATRVGYSERMMFRLLRGLYDRLKVNSRTEALMLARERGWL